MNFLGVDVGTGGSRALLIDVQGAVIAAATVAHAPFSSPQTGWAEQDAADWWRASAEAITNVLSAAEIRVEDLGAVGFSGQMHGAVLLDERDNVLRPAIIWCDQRTQAQCRTLTEKLGSTRLIELTCNPAVTGFTLTKMLSAISSLVIVALAILALGQSSMAQVSSPSPTPAVPASNPTLPTLFVIGDSTANNRSNGALGWGDPFASYFATLKINVVNRLSEIPIVAYLSEKGKAVNGATQDQGPRPGRPLPEPANPKLPTLFLIGDSTVRNGQGDGLNGQWGWGEPLIGYFDETKINVVNRALGGLSSRTYLTFGYWDRALAMLKPGDFVIMQFGHNDSGALNDNSRARGTIKGTGEEVKEIDNLITKKHEVVHSYGWYLRKFVADTLAKGATPIMCSPVPRKIWKDGKLATNSEDYAKWAAEVAASARVGFVDLNFIVARRYEELGPEKVEPLFADERTHTSLVGAELNAASVVAGLKALKKNPLGRYFSAKAKGVEKARLHTK